MGTWGPRWMPSSPPRATHEVMCRPLHVCVWCVGPVGIGGSCLLRYREHPSCMPRACRGTLCEFAT
jgi:hypothetical protein